MNQEDIEKFKAYCATRRSSELVAVMIATLTSNLTVIDSFLRMVGIEVITATSMTLMGSGAKMAQLEIAMTVVAAELDLRMPPRTA